jgi:hypothetical protein
LVVLLVAPLTSTGQDAAAPCQVTNYDPDRRPEPADRPTAAHIGLYVVSIDWIDDIDQSFRADFFMTLTWNDSRLAEVVRASGLRSCRIPIDDVWHPRINLFNRLEFSRQLADVVTVDSEGQVEYVQRFQGSLRSPFDLRDFPLDRQVLPVTLISIDYGPEKVDLRFDTSTHLDGPTRIAGWVVEDEGYRVGVLDTVTQDQPGEGENFVRFDYEFQVRRELGYYVWRVIVPMTFIVLMSWAVFWIDPGMVGVQIGLASTSILTLIAFLFSINAILPPISYLTRIDIFLFASLAIVFVAFAEAVATAVLKATDREKLSLTIDRWARVIFPAAFALIHAALWFA